MTDPDHLARLVHATRLAHEAGRAETEGRARFNLGSWEARSEEQRALDRAIAAAVAAEVRRQDAELAREMRAVVIDADEVHPFDVCIEALGRENESSGEGPKS